MILFILETNAPQLGSWIYEGDDYAYYWTLVLDRDDCVALVWLVGLMAIDASERAGVFALISFVSAGMGDLRISDFR